MEKGLKIALYCVGGLAVVGGAVGITLWATSDEQKRKRAIKKLNDNDGNETEEQKEKSLGSEVWAKSGGVNLRYENFVDDAYPTNKIADHYEGKIGILDSIVDEKLVEGDTKSIYKWYRVKLSTPINLSYYDRAYGLGCLFAPEKNEYCYVREDKVTIK